MTYDKRRVCPNNQVLTYRTTNHDGHREYKSCGSVCADCPYLAQCTQSKAHVKTVTRYIWEPYMEMCKVIRHTLGMKELYSLRKETIERIFGSAKENHGYRYTQMFGKAWMEMKVGLTFACINLKKLARIKAKWGLLEKEALLKNFILNVIWLIKENWLWDAKPKTSLSTVCNHNMVYYQREQGEMLFFRHYSENRSIRERWGYHVSQRLTDILISSFWIAMGVFITLRRLRERLRGWHWLIMRRK